MNNLFRGLLAGYGAKKLGGGCFSTVLVFVLLWVLLGQCGATYAPEASEPSARIETVSTETVSTEAASTDAPSGAIRLDPVAAE